MRGGVPTGSQGLGLGHMQPCAARAAEWCRGVCHVYNYQKVLDSRVPLSKGGIYTRVAGEGGLHACSKEMVLGYNIH